MFVRQEAMHARAHGGAVAEYLNQRGFETGSNTRQEDWLFENLLGDKFAGRELHSDWAKKLRLVFRLGVIAAIEHMNCVLGQYALDNKRWDEAGVDPVLLDLLRWHGAEEIEHRGVAFDLYRHLGGSYPSRYYLSLIAMPVIFGLWAHGAAHLMKQGERFKVKRPSGFRPWIRQE
nr:metal-dependent hydrolase [uncultured Nevskia sp.]